MTNALFYVYYWLVFAAPFADGNQPATVQSLLHQQLKKRCAWGMGAVEEHWCLS